MHSEGFLDTRTKGSKTGLAIVIAGHAAAIVALALVKTQVIDPTTIIRTQIYDTPADTTPPENRRRRAPRRRHRAQRRPR